MILDFFNKELKVGDRVCIAACSRDPKLILGRITEINDSYVPITAFTDGKRETTRHSKDVIKIEE